MTQQEAFERAMQALADDNRAAADYYLSIAQYDDAEIAELRRGAARIRQAAWIIFCLGILVFIVILIDVLGL